MKRVLPFALTTLFLLVFFGIFATVQRRAFLRSKVGEYIRQQAQFDLVESDEAA
jgi:hypothetical protein